MLALQPKVRLIILHDSNGQAAINVRSYFSERLISGLIKCKKTLHDFGRYMEHVDATTSDVNLMLQVMAYRLKQRSFPVATELQLEEITEKYCRYFTDLKIWLDENPTGVCVVQDISFLEHMVFCQQSDPDNPQLQKHLDKFLTHFKKLFNEISSLSVLVSEHSSIPDGHPWLMQYRICTTYSETVLNTENDYAAIAVRYNLFNFGQQHA